MANIDSLTIGIYVNGKHLAVAFEGCRESVESVGERGFKGFGRSGAQAAAVVVRAVTTRRRLDARHDLGR